MFKNFTRKMLPLLLATVISSTAWAADTIKIALTGPFSGGSAAMGVSFRDGAKLAIKKINDEGGIEINGKKMKLEVIERDDEGKNERGSLVAQELSGMADLSAIVGSVNTGVVLAGDKYYQDAKKLKIITPAAGTQSMAQWWGKPIKDLYIFRFSPQDTIQAKMVVDEAVRRGFKKVGVLHDSTNYGVSGRDDLLKNLKEHPEITVVAIEKFNIGDKSMVAQIAKMKNEGAQAILVWGIGPELAAISNDMHTLNFNVPYIGGWTLSMTSYLDNAGKNSEGTLMPQSFIEDPTVSKNVADFINLYRKTYGVNKMPSAMSAAQGYDAILILAQAFREANSTDSTKVKEALENLKTPVKGVIKTWNHPYSPWDPNKPDTHEAFRIDDVEMAIVKGGNVEFAHEEDKKKLQEQAEKSK